MPNSSEKIFQVTDMVSAKPSEIDHDLAYRPIVRSDQDSHTSVQILDSYVVENEQDPDVFLLRVLQES
jgi:hypothetical protein